MRRLLCVLASLVLTSGLFLGCGGGGNEPLRTAPGTDTRSDLEKQSDAMLLKSQEEYNKKVKRR